MLVGVDEVATDLINLLKNIKGDDRWIVRYLYGGTWKIRVLNEYTCLLLISQLEREGFVQSVRDEDAELIPEDYDFFPVSIQDLDKMVFENRAYKKIYGSDPISNSNSDEELESVEIPDSKTPETPTKKTPKLIETEKVEKVEQPKVKPLPTKKKEVPDLVLEYLKKTGAPPEVIDEYLKNKKQVRAPYKHKQGSFWKWTCKIPGIDLSRYMIFNELDKNAAEKINGDNCFVYACKMAGIPEEKLRVMRELIRVESFPKYRIKQICTVVGIRFNIKDAQQMRIKTYGDENAEHVVNIILM
jgi:hypothetical protein